MTIMCPRNYGCNCILYNSFYLLSLCVMQIEVGMCTCQNTCETTEQLGGGCTPSSCVLVPGIEPRSSGSAGVLPAHTYYPQSSCLSSPEASFFVITEIVSTHHGDKNQKIQRSECRQIKGWQSECRQIKGWQFRAV